MMLVSKSAKGSPLRALESFWTWKWRNVAMGALAVIVVAAAVTTAHVLRQQQYTLDQTANRLLPVSPIPAEKLKMTEAGLAYNQLEDKKSAGTRQSLTVSTDGNASGKEPYTATLATSAEEGLTFGNGDGELSFKLKPQFELGQGRQVGSRMVYPEGLRDRHVYTYMRNGVKEDILLSGSPGNEVQYSWKIEAGEKLDVRLLDDGSVGVYSANPYLFGNVQVGDGQTQQLLDKARATDKTHLAFVLPKPFIRDAAGKKNYDDVKFSLDGDILTLTARNMDQQKYPLSIDPSVVVTSSADFRSGHDDGMIDYATTNQIGRNSISLGSTGTFASAGNTFTTARNQHASVAYNGYLYVLGGWNGSANLDDVQKAAINSDGTIGSFSSAGNTFTTARQGHTAVAYNGYLYVIGGSGGGYRNDVQKAAINSDGTIGSFSSAGNSFTTARYRHASVVYNGYLYVIGGTDGAYYADVQKAIINADGSIGAFASAGNSFTTARSSHGSVAYNGYLYVVGGFDGTYLSDVQKAAINSDGTISAFSSAGNNLASGRGFLASAAYGGYLYVTGGNISGTYQNDVLMAALNADGSIGAFSSAGNTFTTARGYHASVAYNGYLYVIGGLGASNQNDVQKATISTGAATGFGSNGSFSSAGNSMPQVRSYHKTLAHNGYLYLVGGRVSDSNNLNDVQKATINRDGTIGTFSSAGNTFTTARYLHDAVIYNNYLYVIGGQDNSGNNLSDVQKAAINADGTIGTFSSAGNSLPATRGAASSVAYNGYLYVTGGYTTSYMNDVLKAAINSDGTIGTFSSAGNSFTNGRSTHQAVAYQSQLYIMGGGGSSVYSDVQKAAINSDGTIGTFSSAGNSLPTTTDKLAAFAYNGYLYAVGGKDGSSLATVNKATINTDGTIGTFASAGTSLAVARHAHAAVPYNGYMYVSGGEHDVSNTACHGTSSLYCSDVLRSALASPAQMGNYERTIDTGAVQPSIDSIVYNGSAVCGARLWYATAGSDGIFGSYTVLDGVAAGATTSIAASSKRYVRVKLVLANDFCGTNSTVTDITLNYTSTNSAPAAPTLSAPANAATGVSTTPQFQLRTTDADNDYLRYKIEVCSTSNCSSIVRTIDQTSSQTGWTGQDTQTSTAYVGNSTIGSSTLASHTYQAAALSAGTQYWWRATAIDPGGTNTFSTASSINTFTTAGANSAPSAPTLTTPANSATGVSLTPFFEMRSSDANGDYLRYRIEVCSTSNCSSIVRTIDQPTSQVGWTGQDTESLTAYIGSSTLASSTLAGHTYQTPALTASTQYWWRAYAIDPGGSNTLSSASSISTFTTSAATAPGVQINGGLNIRGGTKLGN